MTKNALLTFEEWHNAVKNKDFDFINKILDDKIKFFSPAVFKCYEGKKAALFLLSNVIQVFQDFQYHRTWTDTNDWVLEFTAKVKDPQDNKTFQIHGVDIIKFGENNRIVDFAVMIRPYSGLSALRTEMGKRVAQSKL